MLFKKKKEIELLDDEETPKKVIENKIRVSILCMACFLFVIFGIYFATGTNVFHVVTKMVMNGLGVYTEEIPSISIESDDYDQAGSYHIEKSAKWIDTDRARVTFDVDSVIKQEGSSIQDVILVLDISGSMMGSKLEKAISDSKELASYLLSNKNNRFAIIAFDTNSTVVLPLTNNKDEVLMKLDELKVNGCTNYNAALMSVDTIMKDYVKEKGREVVTLFLTDGYPNIDTPNQVGTYALLKDKYPYMTINGIQYEMGKDIINEIKQITDQQFIADQTILNNVLFEATVTPVSYEKFVITDYIHDEYFYIETPDDIKVSIGKVKLEEENGIQKIIWDLEDYMTGRNATMEIDLTLKKKYTESRSYYPTNKKEVIESTLPKEETKKIESTKTPVLKNYYEVIYESNTPEGCHIDNSRKTHYIYENVTKNQERLTCEGYLFKGWEIDKEDGKDIVEVNDDVFIMPGHDVKLKGTWSKHKIVKTMEGQIYESPKVMRAYTSNPTVDYHSSKYKSKITSVKTKLDINIPLTALEVENGNGNYWDVSEAGNESVIAYIEDDGNGGYKLTIGGDGKLIANSNSSYLFRDFSALKEIDLSYLDTTNVTNMNSMFYRCKSLTGLDVSSFNTTNVTDMNFMFSECFDLESLDISNFNTEKVVNMSSMFSECFDLESLDISNFNTEKVVNMSSMFYRCNQLTNLDISSFSTSNVTNMKRIFYHCWNLTNIDVSNFDTSKVINMSSMFDNCNKLTNLDVSNFDTSSVTNMSYMFRKCKNLTGLDTSNFDTSNVTDMQYIFSDCSSLTSLDASSFDTSNVTNMSYMFDSCSSLTSLDVSSFDTSNVTYMMYMFNKCKNLTNLDTSSFDTSNVADMQYIFSDCNNLINLDVSSFDTSKVKNMMYMFYNCRSLTNINVNGFNTSKVTNMSYMFSNCSSLTSLDSSSFDTSNVTNMMYMFYRCSSLTSLDVSSFDTSKVINMSSMFSNCSSLTSLDVSNFKTANVVNMSHMFYDCGSIINLDINSFSTSAVTNMSYMFYGCSSLTSLDISSFNTSNVTNMSSMFDRCSSLTSLDVNNFDTLKVTDMSSMFYNCSSLTSLNLNNFNTAKVTNMRFMFSRCNNLISILVSDKWVMSSNNIAMFSDCGTDHVTVVS